MTAGNPSSRNPAQSASGADSPPQRIGKYEVAGELGRGTAAVVYRARDPFARRDVAIKVFPHKESEGLQGRYRSLFLTEAALVGKLSHPHIVHILDAAVEETFSYVVMDYVRGHALVDHAAASNLLPPEKVVEVIFKVSRALEYMHRHGVIHRDIKPANILIAEPFDVKVTDFGIAMLADVTRTNLMNVGSPAYMSPEQLLEEPLTHQTDIYSLGVVMFQLLTGRLPFTASSYPALIYQILHHEPPPARTFRPDLPDGFDEIMERAMQKDLRVRYQSWMEFGADLAVLARHHDAPREDFSDTRKFHTLKGLSFFRDFREVEIWEAMRIASWYRMRESTVIIREGDTGDAIFFLVEGEVEVSRAGKPLAALKPGDCFGEMLYFTDDIASRTTTITAKRPVQVVEIKAAALSDASDACQVQFNKAFMRVMIDRLTAANRKLSER
ncbi:MAG: cyclic nucleotide-binding domain-containing protein [Betaproteobacteria bacterium]|nr:cyclic nucleotide-binding domain-containing protein [Betaproteobacteria bacterium]